MYRAIELDRTVIAVLSSIGDCLESNMSQQLYLTRGKLPGRFSKVDIAEIAYWPCVVDSVEKIQEFATDIEFPCIPEKPERKGTLKREVYVGIAGTGVGIATQITLLSGGWNRKIRGRVGTRKDTSQVR